MSNVYTLATLNILRAKHDMKPLKAWKESKAKLEAACAKLAKVASVTDLPPNKELAKPAKEATKKPVKTKPAAKAKVEGVSVSTIAKDLGIDPKVARAKLRRSFGDADGTGSNGRWVFTDAKVKEIKAILMGDARKKEA